MIIVDKWLNCALLLSWFWPEQLSEGHENNDSSDSFADLVQISVLTCNHILLCSI